jgi:hypothetical protein
MNYLIPFLVALYIGSSLYGLMTKARPWKNPIEVCASFLMGIGLCSYLAFLQIVVVGRYDAGILIGITCVVMGLLFVSQRFIKVTNSLEAPSYMSHWPVLAALIVFGLGILLMLAVSNPYGDWDSWSLWNYRSYALAVSLEHWKDAYMYSIQAKHPWLFSHWTLFTWTWAGEITPVTSGINSILFSLILPILVIGGLCEWGVPVWKSFLAGAWLLSIPFYYYHGVSQYADLLMACLVTLNMIICMRLMNNSQRPISQTHVLGVTLGMMLLIKDEGLINIFIFLGILVHHFWKKPFDWKILLWPSIVLAAPALILMKMWMFPAPAGVNQVDFRHILDYERWLFIILYFKKALYSAVYGGIYIVPLFVLCRIWGGVDRISKTVLWYLIGFIIGFFVLYSLVKSNLPWRLWSTAYRIEYQLMPLSIMLLFNLFFKRNGQKGKL